MAQDQVCARSSTSSLIQGTGTGTSLMSGHAERRPILEMLHGSGKMKGTPWPLEMGPPEHSETALAWR